LLAMIASRCEVSFMTFGAVKSLVANSKLDVNQRLAAFAAVEAGGVPVTIIVLQVLLRAFNTLDP